MVNNNELLKAYRECEKNCDSCPLKEERCLMEFMKDWEKWAEKQHQSFYKFMQEYNG